MKKWIQSFLIAVFSVLFAIGAAACAKETELPQLSAPGNLRASGTRLVWDPVENAEYYSVKLPEETEKKVTETSFFLPEYTEQTTVVIQVKAVGDGVNYSDSDWAEYTYTYTPVEEPEPGLFKYTLLDDGSGYEVEKSDSNEYPEGEIVIPDSYQGLPVKRIKAFGFVSGKMTGIRLPAGLETIDEGAFSSCTALKSVTVPENVTEIGERAFSNCMALENVVLPDGLKTIKYSMFESCTKLTNMTIPESVTTIEGYAFSFCSKLKSIVLPKQMDEIGKYAFSRCESLESCILPDGIETLDDGFFNFCLALKEVNIPETVKKIGIRAFVNCTSLKSVVIPKSVELIRQKAFSQCIGLKEVVMSEGVGKLESDVFESCKLESLVIPRSLEASNSSFSSMKSLNKVFYGGSMEEWESPFSTITVLSRAELYLYSEDEPALKEDGSDYDGNYWHFVGEEVVIWSKNS